MGNTQLPFDKRLPFVNSSEQHVAEIEGPDPVLDFFQRNAVLSQGRREIEQPCLEPNRAGVGDAFHDVMGRILEWGVSAGIGTGRRAVVGAGVRPRRNSCGRSWLCPSRKPSKASC